MHHNAIKWHMQFFLLYAVINSDCKLNGTKPQNHAGLFVFRPVFRSYQPQDDELKVLQKPKAKPVEGR